MRSFLTGLFLFLVMQSAFSQTTIVRGRVMDTLEKKGLANAVISMLQKSDSTLAGFTRTGADGSFRLQGINPGPYILLVTYPKFADFADRVDIRTTPENDLGQIPLTLKSSLLDAVVIRSAGSVRIKGDTTEFVADSFHVKEGATVEDLLKKLPGFQVNSKGEITTQGQRVGKVLVDGEEFFGDDPTMATQNISAKAVDKVQVFDTKTEQQNLTGITTGSEGKTVNIKLKDDAKKGSFGKAHAASDFTRYVDAKALYNRFVGKKKVSLYGTKSDISTGSLNWEDRQKLGIENDMEYDEISGYYFSFSSGDEFSDWSLRGLPHSYTAGGLFSNKWQEDRNNFNGSYRYNRLATNNIASTLTQNILSSGITYRNRFQKTEGLVQQHSPMLKYEWKLDSLTSFKFTTFLTYKTNRLHSSTQSEFLGTDRSRINYSDQDVDNNSEKMQQDNQLTYRQMFNKKNRLLIATLRYGTIRDRQNSYVVTNTSFYENNMVDSTELADQQKINRGDSRTMGGKITWSEPLGTKWSLVLEYSLNVNNSVSHKNTFNKDFSGKYVNLDSVFSNNFELDVTGHSSTTIFKYTDKKIRAAFGAGFSLVNLDLRNTDADTRNKYHFSNYTPQASIGYTIKPQTRLSFNYRGTTRQPTIDQLQPIRDNADRLNIFIGNPDLKVGFNHNFNLNFNTYKMLSQKGIFIGVSYNIPVNSITFYNTIDVTVGKQTYKPVNVNGNRNWNIWANHFKDASGKKAGYGLNLSANGGRNNNFINGERNTTSYMNSNLEFQLRWNKEEHYSFEIGPKAGYNTTRSTLRPTSNYNYWNYGGSIEFNIQFAKRWEVSSECDFDLREHLDAFPANPNQTLWNASLSRKVFKDKSGKIYLVANDILDQRRGFNRNISSNFISEDRYQRISRYFFLKFEWSFTKMPGGATSN